jgi:hypothetical protein
VQIDGQGHAPSAKSLVLKRSLDALQTDTWATGPAFAVNPGAWQVQYAWKAQLHSPDNSYHGSVALEVLDREGKPIGRFPSGLAMAPGLADGVPSGDPAAGRVAGPIPNPTEQDLRLVLAGRFIRFAAEHPTDRATRRTSPVGDRRRGEPVLAGRPGPFQGDGRGRGAVGPASKWCGIRCATTGAPSSFRRASRPGKAPRKEDRFVYSTVFDIPDDRLAVGKYYELHVEVPQETGRSRSGILGLAILPPAAAKKCSPEQVPFTIRNWDSRIPVYFHLADRLGLRLLGVWGGWSPKEPYKPHCPGIDLCNELGRSGSPARRPVPSSGRASPSTAKTPSARA